MSSKFSFTAIPKSFLSSSNGMRSFIEGEEVVGVFFSFRFLFSTPHREEVLQLSCVVYGASLGMNIS